MGDNVKNLIPFVAFVFATFAPYTKTQQKVLRRNLFWFDVVNQSVNCCSDFYSFQVIPPQTISFAFLSKQFFKEQLPQSSKEQIWS